MSGKQSEAATRGPEPKRRGRPPLAPDARSDKRPRTIRLGDAAWEKLRRLGTEWLERQIASAK